MSNSKVKTSTQNQQDAQAIAKSIQRPGQSKDQTKRIAQGIQKGIEHYKKQQKAKARDLDKALKKARRASAVDEVAIGATPVPKRRTASLPWVLLAGSWLFFLAAWWLF
jgi:acyl transferase domain-containing protein